MQQCDFPPIFFLTLAFILGIVLEDIFKISPILSLLLVLLSLILLGIYLLLVHPAGGSARQSPGMAGGSIAEHGFYPIHFGYFIPFLVFLLLGLFLTSLVITSLEGSILVSLAREGKSVVIGGTVLGEPSLKGDQLHFDFKVESIDTSQQRLKARELTKVIVKNSSSLRIQGGQRLTIKGKPILVSNVHPHYARYLYRKRIQTLFVVDTTCVERKSIKFTQMSSNPIQNIITGFRTRVKSQTSSFLSKDQAGLLIGLLLGDRSRISGTLQDDFRKAGVMHILAVSGLHLGMIATIAYLLSSILRLNPIARSALIAVFMLFYVLLAGCRPSVLRASIMIAVGLLGWLLGREKNLLSAIAVAALILLIYNPFLIYDVAFQLSFMAALAIILIAPTLNSKLVELFPRRVSELLSLSIAAQVGVAPILVYYFNELSLVAVVSNLFVVPAIAPILGLGLAASFMTIFSPFLACPIFKVTGLLLEYVLKITSFFASLPASSIYWETPSSLNICFYYFAVIAGIYSSKRWRKSDDRSRNFNFKTKTRPGRLLIVVLVLMVGVIWWQVGKSAPPKDFTVTFFDVGQGDAALIRMQSGENILIDGGEAPSGMRRSLAARGIRKIDLLVLSHPHADHLGGLTEVIEGFEVGMVLDGGQPHTSHLYKEFLTTINQRGIRYRLARMGQEFEIGSKERKLKILILHPRPQFVTGTNSDLNNNSVVLKLIYGDFSLLFPGDIEREGQSLLLDCGDTSPSGKRALRCTILKVPHHGSANGGDFKFLKEVSPQVAVISVGEGNPFGHPARSTLAKLKSLGAKIYRTDRDGDVTISTDGKNFRVITEK
ncbi:MAG: DNA internalization-related competence protein ComEC/Rec2 [Actinomycetota bacterium]|nr:DNA internalization-related competence protein ComEC/Rec2 [Actinomycetota bacterium]